MTVKELIAQLEGYEPDSEVRLQTQSHYPLQFYVVGTASDLEIFEADDDPDEDVDAIESEGIVYIVEGGQPDNPYGHRLAWQVAEL